MSVINTYIVGTTVGGIMECPEWTIEKPAIVYAPTKEEAKKIYDSIVKPVYFYSEVLYEKIEDEYKLLVPSNVCVYNAEHLAKNAFYICCNLSDQLAMINKYAKHFDLLNDLEKIENINVQDELFASVVGACHSLELKRTTWNEIPLDYATIKRTLLLIQAAAKKGEIPLL